MKDYIYTSINHIKEAIENNRLILFVGAGLSMNSGLPSWNDLIHSFAVELGKRYTNQNKKYSLSEALKIPQLYYNRYSHNAYYRKLTSQIKTDALIPSIVHRALFECQPAHIITTNYDDLLERESKNHLRNYHVVSANEDLPYAQSPNLIIKMHGDIHRKNVVLKEDDYLSYEKNFKLISTYVKSLFTTHVVLFVGFSVTDINFNIIYQWVRDILQDDALPAYLLEPTEKFNVDEYQYYKQRGINLLYYSDVEDKINSAGVINDKYTPHVKKLSNIGRNVCAFLCYLNNDVVTKIDELYKLFLPYSDIKALMPEHVENLLNNARLNVELHHNVLVVSKESALNEALKEVDVFGKFRIKASSERTLRYLWDILRKALIPQINISNEMNRSVKIRSWFFTHVNFDYSNLIEEFNYKEIEEKVNDLDIIVSNDNLFENLEKAYLLAELGRLEESYKLYRSIYTVAITYKDRKYWIAFVARYNMKRVFYLMFANFLHLSTSVKIIFQMKKEIEELRLSDDLKNAPESLKSIISDIDNSLFILDKKSEMERILTNVKDKYRLFVEGGMGWGGGSIREADFILQTVLIFLHYNDLIYKTNEEYCKFLQIYCQVVFTQYIIDNKYNIESRLGFPPYKEIETIPYLPLYYTIISFKPDQLIDFFNALDPCIFQIENDTGDKLSKAFDNLLKFAEKNYLRDRIFPFENLLNNHLIIFAKTEITSLHINSIIDSAIYFLKSLRPIPKKFIVYFYQFLDKQYQYQPENFSFAPILSLLEKFIDRMFWVSQGRKKGQLFDQEERLLSQSDSWKLIELSIRIIRNYQADFKFSNKSQTELFIQERLNKWTAEQSEKTNSLIQGVLLPLYPIVSSNLQSQISDFLCKRFVLEWSNDSFAIFYDAIIKRIIQPNDTLYQVYLEKLHKELIDLQNGKNTISNSEIAVNFLKVSLLIDARLLVPSRHRDILKQLRKNYPFLDYVLSTKTKYNYSNFQVIWFEYLLPTSIDKILKNKVAVPILLQKLQDALERDGNKTYVDLFVRFLKKNEEYKK